MRRREFITLLGASAATWPLAARAQQRSQPLIGFLDTRSPDELADRLRAFREGLKEAGYVEGENVTILYRWADNKIDRMPALAADLVRRRVAALVAPTTAAALTAKAASNTIPTIFSVGSDPVALGLVSSLNRPGGNATGVNSFLNELVEKRLELLREFVPNANYVAVLVNPTNVALAETMRRDAEAAAGPLALRIKLFNAATGDEIHAAFEQIALERPDALFLGSDPFFLPRRVQLATLATRHGLPTSFSARYGPEVGGLMSYGTNINDSMHQVGIYTGRVLKGEKPAGLPIVQATRFELVINLSTAKALGLKVPANLLAIADEVIE